MTTSQRSFLETCTEEEISEACNWIVQIRKIEKDLKELEEYFKTAKKAPQIKVLEEDIEIE